MSSMSSAQIVSATAMHSKSAGLSLGLTPPASYPGAVSSSSPPSPADAYHDVPLMSVSEKQLSLLFVKSATNQPYKKKNSGGLINSCAYLLCVAGYVVLFIVL